VNSAGLQTLLHYFLPGENTAVLETADWSRGIYFIRFTADGKSTARKIILTD
jgi:hypothetical protein